MVSLHPPPHYWQRRVRRLLRLRRCISCRTTLRLAPRDCLNRRRVRQLAHLGEAADKGDDIFPFRIPQPQWDQTFGMGHGRHVYKQAGDCDGVDYCWAYCCGYVSVDLQLGRGLEE